MGLEITAASKLQYLGPYIERDDSDYYAHPWKDPFFRQHSKDLERGGYAQTPESKELSFSAGSYGTYNRWRQWLCRTMLGVAPFAIWEHPERFVGCPFVELINYADNEGEYGPTVAAKLAKDFADHEEQARAASVDYEFQLYQLWKQAFELAADGGMLMLH